MYRSLSGYIIEKRSSRRPDWSVGTRIPANQCEATVGNLVEGTEYYFRVMAENQVGVGEPLESEVKVTPKSLYGELV